MSASQPPAITEQQRMIWFIEEEIQFLERTIEKFSSKPEMAPSLELSQRKLKVQRIALASLQAEPEYFYRKRSDGGREGPLHASEIEEVRKASWEPLYAVPPVAALKPIDLNSDDTESPIDWYAGAKTREMVIDAIRDAGYEVTE